MSKPKSRHLGSYIHLLSGFGNGERINEQIDGEDALFCGELIDDGYLKGEAFPDEGGIWHAIVNAITTSGRDYLDILVKRRDDASPIHITKKLFYEVLRFSIYLLLGLFLTRTANRLLPQEEQRQGIQESSPSCEAG